MKYEVIEKNKNGAVVKTNDGSEVTLRFKETDTDVEDTVLCGLLEVYDDRINSTFTK